MNNCFSKVPPELQEYPNWVCGDKDKVPHNPKRRRRKTLTNIPAIRRTFEQAMKCLDAHKDNDVRLLGFEVGENPFVDIDQE